MFSKKKTMCIVAILIFLLTLTTAYAADIQTEDNSELSADISTNEELSIDSNDVELSNDLDDEKIGSESNDLEKNSEVLQATETDSYIQNSNEISFDDLDYTGNLTDLQVQGFTSPNLNMTDFAISIVPGTDSSSISLKFDIPFVSYNDYNQTSFDFSDLELFIQPCTDPASLDLYAILSSLNIIHLDNGLNLTDLLLSFKHEGEYLTLDIDIPTLSYTNFKDTFFELTGLRFSLMTGLNASSMYIFTFLDSLNLINFENGVNLTNLDMHIRMPDLGLENLDLSIFFSSLNYTDFKDKSLNLTDVLIDLIPILNSTSMKTSISMSTFNYTGLNISDLDVTGFNIAGLNLQNMTTTGLNLSGIDLSGLVSTLDTSSFDVSSIISYLSAGFNMSNFKIPSTYLNSLNLSGLSMDFMSLSNLDLSNLNLSKFLSNINFASLNATEFNLTDMIEPIFDYLGINASDIDMDKYDFSKMNITDMLSLLDEAGLDLSDVVSKLDLNDIDFDNVDLGKLISNFNITGLNLSAIMAEFNLTGFNLTEMMGGFNLEDLLKLICNHKENKSDNKSDDKPTPSPAPAPNAEPAQDNSAAVPDDNPTPNYSVPSYSRQSNYNTQPVYTVYRASDMKMICQSNIINLKALIDLFKLNLTNGHLKVYVDGTLVFEGDVDDDLSKVIFEIIEKFLGKHVITVEFTDKDGKTQTLNETIIIE